MFKRAIGAIVLAATLVASLTACTPPMPPEVRAALAEQTFTCEPGTVDAVFPSAISELAPGWAESMIIACPEMILNPVGTPETSSLSFNTTGATPTFCKAYSEVPFALDATVIALNVPDLGSLNLTAKAVQAIFDGSITNWSDPVLAKLNPDFALPDLAIVVYEKAQKNGLAAFTTWMSRLLGQDFAAASVKPVSEFTLDELYALPIGGIALAPYSVNVQAMLPTASIVLDEADLLNSLVPADSGTLYSASTQWKIAKTESKLTVSLNPEAKPLAPEGQDVALSPYQAIYPVTMSLCGEDNLTTRAVARFLLRQDSQGLLGAGYVISLPEAVRVEALVIVSVGLPEPELDPALLEQ